MFSIKVVSLRLALSIFHGNTTNHITQYNVHWNEWQNRSEKKGYNYYTSDEEVRSKVGAEPHTRCFFHRCWRRSTIVFTTSIQGTHARAISTNKTWIPIYRFKQREVNTVLVMCSRGQKMLLKIARTENSWLSLTLTDGKDSFCESISVKLHLATRWTKH